MAEVQYKFPAPSGERYGSLVVQEELEKEWGKRMVSCLCDCGKVVKAGLYSLRKLRKDPHCGCRSGKHRESKTKLYRVYSDMKRRSKKRRKEGDMCYVYQPWVDDFLEFKRWAIENGYKEGLHLCRNRDKGNYEPDNCRWDTNRNNGIEGGARSYDILREDGSVFKIYNLNQYCKDNNLKRSTFMVTEKNGRFYNGMRIIRGAYDER